MVDRYTKIVLAVIALALVALAPFVLIALALGVVCASAFIRL